MEWITFLHALGAVAVGFYLLMPFAAGRMDKLTLGAKEGYLSSLFLLNRFGQWILIAQFLTGGYLISQQDYQYWWIVLVIVFFILVGAFAGMMGGPMKRALTAYRSGSESAVDVRKVKTFSILAAVFMLVLIFLMYMPYLFGSDVLR